MNSLHNTLKERRRSFTISQKSLADSIHISRQAYSAIETGEAVPSTEIALRLAQALETSVEALFSLGIPSATEICIEAKWYGSSPALPNSVTPVRIEHVGENAIAVPMHGNGVQYALTEPDGFATPGNNDELVDVSLWPKDKSASERIVTVGCDPAISIVASYLSRENVQVSWYEEGSLQALNRLAAGEAHIAGCHLLDDETGEYNLSWIERLLPFPSTVVTFSFWEQGLMVYPGNPKQVRGIEDLARPGISMVNRKHGAGARSLLDQLLKEKNIEVQSIAGYGREASGHIVVASSVATGLADTGIGIKSAALATGLEFIPLRAERYDLVIPNHFLDLENIQHFLNALKENELKKQIEALGGYDINKMGLPVSG